MICKHLQSQPYILNNVDNSQLSNARYCECDHVTVYPKLSILWKCKHNRCCSPYYYFYFVKQLILKHLSFKIAQPVTLTLLFAPN